MINEAQRLPDDIHALKALVVSLQTQLAEETSHYRSQIAHLREQLNLLLAKRYGRSSEKHPGQLGLFDEAEQTIEQATQEAAAGPSHTTVIPAHTRKKPARQPLPDHIERHEVLHDMPEKEKFCPHDGQALVRIGEEVSEQLDVIPAQVRVLRHIRPKYACPCCKEGVKTAPMPPQPLPKSIASPGLLAHVATAKYVDSLPLYRLEAILQRSGIRIGRATLAHWMVKLGELILPLMNLLRDHLLAYDILHMDETRVRVLKEEGKSPTSQSYMWVQRGGPPSRPVILFDYDPTRAGAVPVRLLDGYVGHLVCDGYEGYALVGRQAGVVLLGCWAHARRKFDEAIKALGRQDKAKGGRAAEGLALIQGLYRVEKSAKGMSPQARYQLRQAQAVPLLEEIRTWLDTALPQVPPQTTTGKALHYLHNQWPKLIGYVADGRLPIDNNAAERAIRPFVIGRNNWMFSHSVAGAEASARLYSLILTAKANGHEPYRYLRHIFTELPAATSVEAFEALLPYNLDPASLV